MGLQLAAHVSYLGLVGTECLQLGFCSATNTIAALLSIFHRVCTQFPFEQDIAAQAADFLDDQGALEELCKRVAQWLFEQPPATGSCKEASFTARAQTQCGDRAQVRSCAAARAWARFNIRTVQLCKHVGRCLFRQPPATENCSQHSSEARPRAQCGDRAQVRSSAAALDMSLHTAGTNCCIFGEKPC